MNKKWFSVLMGFLVIAALLAGASGALAQAGPSPIHSSQNKTPFTHMPEAATPSSSAPDALSLGQSGTSFRYLDTIGVTNEPYVSDTAHLNSPHGVFVDSANNLFVAEIWGDRVLKYNSSGTNLLEIGAAGVAWHHDNFLSEPRDVAVDSDGNIWVVMTNALKQFDADGNVLQIFPADDPWAAAQDNGHFNTPQGIAFDSSGLMYVADSANQRIQIFDISGITPVYQGTIGVTGEARSDNSGFDWPHRVAFDSLNRLYVADESNFRVQRCTYSSSWTCETFVGVTDEWGTDTSHLGWVYGLEVRGNSVYIADTGNARVLKCDLVGSCANFAGESGVGGSDNTHFSWPTDIAVDSADNVYVADETNARVQIYDSVGSYVTTRGVTQVPYLTDDTHLNTPWGLSIANDGGLLVTEQRGARLVKYDVNLNQEWAYGIAGVGNLDYGSGTLEGNPAQDSSGDIYYADTWHQQIIILSGDGELLDTMGVLWESGNDNGHFDGPRGVAVSPVNQDIYVVDTRNQRIQVFDKDHIFKTTLGVRDETGDDSQHFNNPSGVVIDATGNIFVADTGNNRIQKCNLSGSIYTCTTFAGVDGVFDSAFDHFYPIAVTIDNAGNVYVADDWNSRVQVYDNAGNYLTTIAGSWGTGTSQLVQSLGVAVDADGNVYVADGNNHRIQRFAPGYPNWTQANLNGFGDRRIEQIPSFAVFNNQLYAGAWLWNGDGVDEDSQLWRSSDGKNWAMVGSGFGNSVSHMAVFDNKLFVGTWDGNVFYSSTGTDWTQVVTNGFENTGLGIARFQVYNGQLYAGTWSEIGTQIWRTSNGTNWTKFNTDGFGDPTNTGAPSSVVFNGLLYYGVGNWDNSGQLWRTDGTTWTQVNSDGFGDGDNKAVSSLTEFKGSLFAGTFNNNGIQVYRSENGSSWTPSIVSGLDSPNNIGWSSMVTIDDTLFLVVSNMDGVETWKTNDGQNWVQISAGGFGDSNNYEVLQCGAIGFQEKLFMGTGNFSNGSEIWRYEPEKYIYLPLILNNPVQQIVPSTWKKITSPTTSALRSIEMVASGDGWAVGNGGTIVRWNGSSWSTVTSPTANTLNSIDMLSSSDGWAVGNGGTIVRWNGSSWSTVTSPTANTLNSISMLSSSDGWAVGNGGTILRWNGSNWANFSSPTAYDLFGTAFLSSSNGWAVGGGWSASIGWFEGAKLHWNGSSWSVDTTDHILDILYDVDFSSPTYGWAVGMNNAKSRWDGANWHQNYGLQAMNSSQAVEILSANDGWAVGWNGSNDNIRHWDGTTWNVETSPVSGELHGITMSSSTEGWAVGDNGNILRYGP